MNGNSPPWAHIGRWSGRSTCRSTQPPCRSDNGSEWQFYSLSSYCQMKWQIHWQIDPTSCRSANGSEWQFYSFELILADEVADLLADLPHPPVDLPMDLNGNFTVTSDIGQMKWQIYWQIYPPHRSTNQCEWQFYCYSSYWQMKRQIYWQIYLTPLQICQWIWMEILLFELTLADEVVRSTDRSAYLHVDLPMDLNGNSTHLSSY